MVKSAILYNRKFKNLTNPHFPSIDKLNVDEMLRFLSTSKIYLMHSN